MLTRLINQNGVEIDNEKLDSARDEFISSELITLKEIAVRFDLPYRWLLEIAKRDKWREARNGVRGKTQDTNDEIVESIDDQRLTNKTGGPLSPLFEGTLKEEIENLRKLAFGLATTAGESLASKSDWNVKDFDQLVGTWAKVVGTEAKVNGDADDLERVFNELSDGDDNPDAT